MRLWTLHPRYLDPRGFCGLWREALLAQAVLLGNTKGYRNHPQLERFNQHPDSVEAIATYLVGLYEESLVRGYNFDVSKVGDPSACARIPETEGQLAWELEHLKAKLRVRSPEFYDSLSILLEPEPHPMFEIVAGPVRSWERASGPAG